jgi:hypothetical protein
MCGFLDALDLSAVHSYGDERPITSSASNSDSPTGFGFAQNKSYKKFGSFGSRISFFLKKDKVFLQKGLQFAQNYDIILSVAEMHTGV